MEKSLDGGSDQKDSKRTKQTNDSSKSSKSSNNNGPHKGLTDDQKALLKQGTVFAAAAVATYATYKLVNSEGFQNAVQQGLKSMYKYDLTQPVDDLADQASEAFEASDAIKEVASKTGFNIKKTVSSAIDDAKQVNPNWSEDLPFTSPYNNNCGYTTVAWDLRRRGLDIKVKDDGNTLSTADDLKKFYKDFKAPYVKVDTTNAKTIVDSISKQIDEKFGTDDGYGIVGMWRPFGAGHWFSYVRENGQLKFLDPQSGGKRSPTEFFLGQLQMGYLRDEITIGRLDNLELNAEALKEQFDNFTR